MGKSIVQLKGNVNKTLLWTNPNPSSSFNNTTGLISSSIGSLYDAIEMTFFLWTGYQNIACVQTLPKGVQGVANAVASTQGTYEGGYTDALARAWVFHTEGQVDVSGGVETQNSTWRTNNQVLIPYQIYGIKYL